MRSKLFGVLLLIETAALLLTAAVAFHYQRVAGETDARCFLLTAALTGAVGMLLYNIGRSVKKRPLQIRDSFLVVALSWVLFSVFGMLPFLMYGSVDNVTDAFFETMSGFSTTGATILDNIDQQPHGILFWRSIMQWMGGLGVVVFTLAFIPSVAKGSKKVSLFAAEAPGLSVEKLAPTMGATSRLLWIIYIALTLLCAIAFVSAFQRMIFSYGSPLYGTIDPTPFVAIFFTLLFIMRFFFAPRFDLMTDEQLASHPQTWWERIRTSLFHVVALLSNTGFQGSNYDYDLWGRLFLIPTVIMMIVGGCAGSTSGGIKMVRVIVLFRYMKKTVYEMLHSSSVYNVKVSGQTVDELALKRVVSFFSLFIILFMGNVVALSAMGMSMEDGAISFLTCFSNYGPGSGITGPSGNFDAISNGAKWLLSFDMLVGRLEIFTILLLFTRSFWRTE